MNFFKDLFNLKRTRMIDEAVFFHRPVTLGKSILSFIIFMIVANLIVAVGQSIPLIFYFASNQEVMNALTSGENIDSVIENFPSWIGALELVLSGLFIFIAIFYCKKYENRTPMTMGLHKRGCVPEYLIGFLVGGGMIGLTLAACALFGSVKVSVLGFAPIVLLFIVGFIIQGFAENTFVHGYFTVSVARDYAPIVAISLGSVAFSLFSLSGTGITVVSFINVLLLGFFLGIYMFKRGSIIGCSAVLAGWNVMQNAVFGSSEKGYSFFLSLPTGSVFVNGGAGGVGGGLIATVILVVATFLLLLTKPKRSEISDFEVNF